MGRELFLLFESYNSLGQVNEIKMQMGKASEQTQEQYPGLVGDGR